MYCLRCLLQGPGYPHYDRLSTMSPAGLCETFHPDWLLEPSLPDWPPERPLPSPATKLALHDDMLRSHSTPEGPRIVSLAESITVIAKEPFLRPPPPLLDISEEEVVWTTECAFQPTLMWDLDMCVSSSVDPKEAEVIQLMQRAFKYQLLPSQQQLLLTELDTNFSLLSKCGLTPRRLPELIENNLNIAIEVLLKMSPSPQIHEYLQTLMNMRPTLHSMEVVNRLLAEVKIPHEFIQLYLENCIKSCETVSERDRSPQSLMVRLVCTFWCKAISLGNVDVEDLLVELSSFCFRFLHLEEAKRLSDLLGKERQEKEQQQRSRQQVQADSTSVSSAKKSTSKTSAASPLLGGGQSNRHGSRGGGGGGGGNHHHHHHRR